MRTSGNILNRPRVNRYLDQMLDYPLTVVQAPMGFGKTTALHDYFHTKHLQYIWLSLLGSGDALSYCWERLTVQIRRNDAALADRLESLGFPMDAPQLAKMVDLIGEISYQKPMLVVVDDYHLIDCPQTVNLITLIAAEKIPNLHLVLLARNISVLPVADLEQRGLCLVVEKELLLFRTTEIRAYFNLMGYKASEETVQCVRKWTDGWISGIYLLLRGLRQGMPVGRREGINQLLETNLFRSYDEETQMFLLKLSSLDTFTPQQIVYVFDDPAAGDKLFSLVHGNTFLMYSHSLNAYKMTDLLQAFLQEKAQQRGLNPCPLWRRMGQWLLIHRETVPAYHYLYQAGDVETILQDLDREDAQDIHIDQFPQIHQIFEGLPAQTAFRYPLATLRHIRVRALSVPPAAREELDTRLRKMEEYFRKADLPSERRSRILGEIHNTWIFVAFNDVREVVGHARQAVLYFAGRYSCIVSNRTEFTYGAPNLLYCYYREPGKLKKTADFIAENFHFLAQAVEGCGSGSELLALAEYALETGNFDRVSYYAKKAIYLSRTYRQNSIEICATFALARLHLLEGNFEEGIRLIQELSTQVGKQDSSVLNTTIVLCLAYLNSCYGKLEEIPAWLQKNELEIGSFFFQGVAFPYIISMKAALLAGDFLQLEVLCETFRGKFALYHNQLGFLHKDIYAAVAAYRLYGMEAGLAKLERALALAAPDHIIMPFAESAQSILPMLAAVTASIWIPESFLRQVRTYCQKYQKGLLAFSPVSVCLTKREQKVLEMLASGLKHEEIAAKLFVSVPTVRYHVKNIYQKLDVHNKVAAIQKAKTLHLI